MALFPLSLTMVDAFSRVTTRSFLVSAASFGDAQTAVTAFVPDYQAVTQLGVFKSRLTDEQLYANAAGATANVDEGMTISVQLDTPGKKGIVQVPGPVASIRNSDGTIDITAAVMTDFEANYTGGAITASDGEEVDSFIKATLDK